MPRLGFSFLPPVSFEIFTVGFSSRYFHLCSRPLTEMSGRWMEEFTIWLRVALNLKSLEIE